MRIVITGGSGFIGTNAIEYYTGRGATVLNIDLRQPKDPLHGKFWLNVDLRDRQKLVDAIADFRPTHVLNLAAATGAHIPGLTQEYFAANTRGIENLIFAIVRCGTVKRSVFASSLLVCRNGYIPKDDLDYCAPNAYGESKVAGELVVRNDTALEGKWVIVRPSSVWGPWFEAYTAFFQLVSRGLYFTISGTEDLVKPVTFVGNTVYMLDALLTKDDSSSVEQHTYYLVDYPEITVHRWAEVIRIETGRRRTIPVVPLMPIKAMARVGDLLKAFGWKDPPLTSFRVENLMTGGHYPFEPIRNIAGPLPYSLQDGVRLTVDWMRRQRLL